MGRLVVKSHRPARIAVLLALGIVVLGMMVWYLLDYSRWRYIYGEMADSRNQKILWEINRSLEAETTRLRERVAILERAGEVEKRAGNDVQETLKLLQDEIFDLREELSFYQGIVIATGTAKGLTVQGLYLEPLGQEQHYRYKLVLTHVAKSDRVAEGMVDMVVEGDLGGVSKRFRLQEIADHTPVDLSFRFKYFHKLEGAMVLPAGFQPRRVFVELHPKDKTQSKVERVFDWPELAG
ncbi:MAG: hypothetical protein L0Y67_00805 [Gammaproteobacteria bacterium]|nr:hypothetical protein [Gammaproteobacteria bacterium]MCI0590144.1 hypothetical protein [Gammaproteobacteria bacterium]